MQQPLNEREREGGEIIGEFLNAEEVLNGRAARHFQT